MIKKINELNEGGEIYDDNMYAYQEFNTGIVKKISHKALKEDIKKKLLNTTPESNLLFETKHLDYILEHKNWKICLNYEWYSGDEFPVAWKHLIKDIAESTNETIKYVDQVSGTYTCNVFVSKDRHRIIDVANISAAEQIYNNLNVGWFFIVDQTNKRFKIPRNAWYEKSGNVNEVGNYRAPGLPNIEGFFCVRTNYENVDLRAGHRIQDYDLSFIGFNLSRNNPLYKGNNVVKTRGIQMIKYMYLE